MKIVISVTACALLTACAGQDFSWDQARRIRAGMTRAELIQVMGEPGTVRTMPDGTLRYIWVHATFTGASKSVYVTMKDGTVVSAPQIPDEFK